MIFDTIYYQWNEIKLKHPINAKVSVVNHHYEIENKTLNILLNASSYDNCETLFQDAIDLLYDEIGLEPDDNLTKNELEIKYRLLWHIGMA